MKSKSGQVCRKYEPMQIFIEMPRETTGDNEKHKDQRLQ
jgi:hypothetical protein